MIEKIKEFRDTHADMYEFIMFNILSNVATLVSFVVINLGNKVLFTNYADVDFEFWVFDYSVANGGLCMFLSFLLSYVLAQSVNFVVQRKVVFKSNSDFEKAVPIYIIMVVSMYFLCMYVQTIVVGPLMMIMDKTLAVNVSNIIVIIVQVVISYPMMKFVIMPKNKENK